MIRKAKAVWRGTGREGDGDLTSDSGVLSEMPEGEYSGPNELSHVIADD